MASVGEDGRLAGKVALITGTAGGQGREAALEFAREGATVVGCDVDGGGARKTAELVSAEGGRCTGASVDLGDSRATREWVDGAAREFGGMDVLYNNASRPRLGTIDAMSDEDWRATIRNELDLVFFACRAAWPHLIERGGGSIINVGSVSGLVALSFWQGGIVAHAATKGAVIAMSRELALEGGPHGIRVNTISPGVVETPATAPALGSDSPLAAAVTRSSVLGRVGKPTDVAPMAVFLASDEAGWVSGANFVVDGGLTAAR